MAFLVFHTPRVGSGKPALILPPGQHRHVAALGKMLQVSAIQGKVAKASSPPETSLFPLRLNNAIGIVILQEGAAEIDLAHAEFYLLVGVDTAKMDGHSIREIQSKLASEIVPKANLLITRDIPWQHRNDPAFRSQFPGEAVVREELNAFASQFPALPEASLHAKNHATDLQDLPPKKNTAGIFVAVVLLLLVVSGGVLFARFLRARAEQANPKALTEVAPPRPAAKPTPQSFTPSKPSTPERPTSAPARPMVFTDPYLYADIELLQQELQRLKETRTALLQTSKQPPNTPVEIMQREVAIQRFNRRRTQLLSAFARMNTEAGQSLLEPIPLPNTPSLSSQDLETLQKFLTKRRSQLNATDLNQVEEFSELTEWVNRKAAQQK